MEAAIVNKSVFSIHPSNKKNVTVGFSIDSQIKIVILFECILSKRTIHLDLTKWQYFIDEDQFKMMLSKLYTNTKRVIISKNFYYTINQKNETITLQTDAGSITLTRYNLLRLKELQSCIDSYIFKKQNELNLYQSCFNLIYSLLKRDIQDLPEACQCSTFVSTYIHNYNFNLTDLCCEQKCFIHEVQQFHYEKLSNMLLQDLRSPTLATFSFPFIET